MSDRNPFIERSRITDPRHFAGRWGELSMLFERLEAGRPVLVTGAAGIGKSSFLTHTAQAAATAMDQHEMRTYYLDLSVLPGAADAYRLIVGALGGRGAARAALEIALLEVGVPVLLCLDNADAAIAAGWGTAFVEELARIGRARQLKLVVAANGPAPLFSERFAQVNLGAFAPPEVRLMTDAYLDETDVVFSPGELRELADLSVAHPAYLQRAAYHLFESKVRPGGDWRAAYLAEARERPVPGAPLPPAVFEGAVSSRTGESAYGGGDALPATAPGQLPLPALNTRLAVAVLFCLTLALVLIALWS
jgi:hypothetical protein